MAEAAPTTSLVPGRNTVDPQTANLIQRNSLALGTVANQVANISAQMSVMSTSLAQVQQTIAQNTFLERQRELNEQKRQEELAQAALRAGKESRVESKITGAIMNPIRRMAQKAEFTLNRMMGFLSFLMGGWLLNQTLQWFKANAEGNQDMMEVISDRIKKSMLALGAIFAISLIGVGTVISGFTSLALKIGSWAVKGLILTPLRKFLQFLSTRLGLISTRAVASGGTRALAAGLTRAGTRPRGSLGGLLTNAAMLTGGVVLGSNFFGGNGDQNDGARGSMFIDPTNQDMNLQTVERDNQWWDFLDWFGNGQRELTEEELIAQNIVNNPAAHSQEQVEGAVQILQNVVPQEEEAQPSGGEQQGGRGFWGSLGGIVDAVTLGATDFDQMGSEGQVFQPVSGGRDARWGTEAVPEQQPIFVPRPQGQLNLNMFGASENTPVNNTPNISSRDDGNIYALSAQTNFNVMPV